MMREQNLGVLLIPLLAMVTVALPMLGRSPDTVTALQTVPVPPTAVVGTETLPSQSAPPQRMGVDGMLRAFGEAPDRQARRCIIATVPDPIDAANLAYTFDRYVDAMQRAMEAVGYTLDRFDLPWRDPDSAVSAIAVTEGFQDDPPIAATREAAITKTASGAAPKPRLGPRFRAEPGVLLFRGRDTEKGQFALLFLVGETPTAGVHQRALKSAVTQYKAHCGQHVRLLAPAFSGSVTSLRSALTNRAPSQTDPLAPGQFTIVSGSATAVDPAELDRGFRATVLPDGPTLQALAHEIQRLEGGRAPQIGLLTEANTGYGSAVQSTASESASFRSLPFPLHVAKLRQVAQPAPSGSLAVNPSATTKHRLTALDLRSTTEAQNVVPLFSKIETSSIEMALSTLLQTISREHLRYICIVASDVHDRIFLIQELRHHAPNTVLIALSSDLLYLHPDVNLDFRGMLVVSPYPLFAANQFWTDGARAGARRLLFAAQTAQGVYNAAVVLLDRAELMQEYGRPLDRDGLVRPWLSMVGANSIWPIRLLDGAAPAVTTVMDGYLYRPSPHDRPPGQDVTAPFAGGGTLEPEAHPWFVVLLALASLTSTSTILAQLGVPGAARARRPHLDHWMATSRFSALFSDQVYARHRFERRLYLLMCCGVFLVLLLLSASIVAVVPITFGVHLSTEPRPYWAGGWRLALAILVVVALATTGSALVGVWRTLGVGAWRARRWVARSKGRMRARAAARLTSLGGVSLVLVIVLTLTGILCWQWLRIGSPTAVMLERRSLDLASGVSPLLPLFFIGGAAILWAVSALRRLRLLDGVDHDGTSFLGLNAGSFEGVGKLERDVLIAVGRPSLKLSPSTMIPFGLLLVAAWVRLFLIRTTPTVEGAAYDWLFRIAFLLVYFALLMSFLRFGFLWFKLRRLLLRLSWHPSISAYQRLREEIPGKPKVGVAVATQVYTALEFSVDRASRLMALADRMAVAAAPVVKGAPPRTGVFARFRCLLGLSPPPAGASAAAKALTAHVAEIRHDLSEHVAQAERALKDALAEEARHAWRSAIRKRSRAEASLAEISRLVAAALERAWRLPADLRPEPGASGQKNQPSDEERWFDYGEDFIASRVVSFVSYIVPQLQNLIVFLTAGMLLMLLAVTSYPFQPLQLLIDFNWMFVSSVAITILIVLVQMERDTVLSVLSDTTPGQITWNRDFVARIVIYVLVPVVGVLGAQFPSVTQALLSSVSALFGGRS
jgi:hypothetical protein